MLRMSEERETVMEQLWLITAQEVVRRESPTTAAAAIPIHEDRNKDTDKIFSLSPRPRHETKNLYSQHHQHEDVSLNNHQSHMNDSIVTNNNNNNEPLLSPSSPSPQQVYDNIHQNNSNHNTTTTNMMESPQQQLKQGSPYHRRRRSYETCCDYLGSAFAGLPVESNNNPKSHKRRDSTASTTTDSNESFATEFSGMLSPLPQQHRAVMEHLWLLPRLEYNWNLHDQNNQNKSQKKKNTRRLTRRGRRRSRPQQQQSQQSQVEISLPEAIMRRNGCGTYKLLERTNSFLSEASSVPDLPPPNSIGHVWLSAEEKEGNCVNLSPSVHPTDQGEEEKCCSSWSGSSHHGYTDDDLTDEEDETPIPLVLPPPPAQSVLKQMWLETSAVTGKTLLCSRHVVVEEEDGPVESHGLENVDRLPQQQQQEEKEVHPNADPIAAVAAKDNLNAETNREEEEDETKNEDEGLTPAPPPAKLTSFRRLPFLTFALKDMFWMQRPELLSGEGSKHSLSYSQHARKVTTPLQRCDSFDSYSIATFSSETTMEKDGDGDEWGGDDDDDDSSCAQDDYGLDDQKIAALLDVARQSSASSSSSFSTTWYQENEQSNPTEDDTNSNSSTSIDDEEEDELLKFVVDRKLEWMNAAGTRKVFPKRIVRRDHVTPLLRFTASTTKEDDKVVTVKEEANHPSSRRRLQRETSQTIFYPATPSSSSTTKLFQSLQKWQNLTLPEQQQRPEKTPQTAVSGWNPSSSTTISTTTAKLETPPSSPKTTTTTKTMMIKELTEYNKPGHDSPVSSTSSDDTRANENEENEYDDPLDYLKNVHLHSSSTRFHDSLNMSGIVNHHHRGGNNNNNSSSCSMVLHNNKHPHKFCDSVSTNTTVLMEGSSSSFLFSNYYSEDPSETTNTNTNHSSCDPEDEDDDDDPVPFSFFTTTATTKDATNPTISKHRPAPPVPFLSLSSTMTTTRMKGKTAATAKESATSSIYNNHSVKSKNHTNSKTPHRAKLLPSPQLYQTLPPPPLLS